MTLRAFVGGKPLAEIDTVTRESVEAAKRPEPEPAAKEPEPEPAWVEPATPAPKPAKR